MGNQRHHFHYIILTTCNNEGLFSFRLSLGELFGSWGLHLLYLLQGHLFHPWKRFILSLESYLWVFPQKVLLNCHYWGKYAIEDPFHQWMDDGSFELEKLLYLKKILKSTHPKQLSYWYVWEDQIKERTQRSTRASLRASLHKMKKQKAEQKLKTPSNINPLSPAYKSFSPSSLSLQKIFWIFGPLVYTTYLQTQFHLLSQFSLILNSSTSS